MLRRTDDPHLAVADVFQVLGQTIEIQDQVGPWANVLTDFINDEDDVFLARCLTGNLQHFTHTVVFENNDLTGFGGERGGRLEKRGVQLMRDLRDEAVYHQLIVAIVVPVFTARSFFECIQEFVVAAFLLESAFQRSHLEIARVARPLQDLVEQDRRHLFHGRTGDLFAGQV